MITKPFIRRRFLAAFIDYGIINIVFILLLAILGTPEEDGRGSYKLHGYVGLLPILFWGIMTIGLEQLFGSTLGNGIVGLKPISESGVDSKISVSQSLKRHLLDMVDMFCFGIVGYLVIKSNPKSQRLGDIWAKTIVVKSNM